jgi:hypothetical protein
MREGHWLDVLGSVRLSRWESGQRDEHCYRGGSDDNGVDCGREHGRYHLALRLARDELEQLPLEVEKAVRVEDGRRIPIRVPVVACEGSAGDEARGRAGAQGVATATLIALLGD